MDEEDSEKTAHHEVIADDVEVSGELGSGDNSTSDHTVMVDPDQLIGPAVIDMIMNKPDMIMNKPEFSFLIRYYSLLYLSLIPNCKLTINTLRQHISISDDIEQYIVGAASHRTSCQRLINFLLTRLYSEKDYMQFCYHLNIISVMTDLPNRLIAEFRTNGNWRCNTQSHPGLSFIKPQSRDFHHIKCDLHMIIAMDVKAMSALGTIHQQHLVNDIILQTSTKNGASDGRADKCSVSDHYHHNQRRRCVAFQAIDKPSSKVCKEMHISDLTTISAVHSNVDAMDLLFLLPSSEWRVLEERFNLLCNALSHNHQLTIDKLKTLPQLLQDGEQLCKLILSSSADVRMINKKIITYFFIKLCYSGNSPKQLYDVMDRLIDSTDTSTGLQQSCYATTVSPSLISTVMVNSIPSQPSVSPIMQSLNMDNSQENISGASQPSSCVTIVSYTHTTVSSSSVTSLNVVECLTTSSSVVTSISGQDVYQADKDDCTVTTISDEYEFPKHLCSNKDFAKLRAYYHTILDLMPDNYEITTGKLQNYISDDQVCAILGASNSTLANKIILHCLIKRISCPAELLDMCDQLESVITSHNLRIITNDIRIGVQQSIEIPITTTVTTSTQSVSLKDQQFHLMPPSGNSRLYQMLFSQIKLSPTSKVLAVLKKNYTKLWQCLPLDYMKTITTIHQLGVLHTTDDVLRRLTDQRTPDAINKHIIANLMLLIEVDEVAKEFCNVMEILVDSNSKVHVDILRNEILEALNYSSLTKASTSAQSISTITSITVGEQFTKATTAYHALSVSSVGQNSTRPSVPYTSSVSSMKHTTTSANSGPNLPQEILEALNYSSLTKASTSAQSISTITSITVDEQFTKATTVYHALSVLSVGQNSTKPSVPYTSSVSSMKHTTTSANSGPQLPQGNTKPEIRYLHRYIVPKYSTKWEELGLLLEVPTHHLDIIKRDHPSSVKECCKKMLRKWMEITPDATWNKLYKAIDGLPSSFQPPPLPPNHVDRQELLDEIAIKLLQATSDPSKFETTLTITGAGGFGKTTIATSLCYRRDIKEKFNHGFVFIELGPQAPDPSIKLNQSYHLLTGENLEGSDINYAENEIRKLTKVNYRNLLVIIDDVWDAENAIPLVSAFSNCVTILTTRMNDIDQYIPSKESVVIGPMTQNEAISLLTKDIITSHQLSQEDMSILEEVAQDVHLWPLLLSLIRGHLSYILKQQLSYHSAIQKVHAKLYHNGLTAFDKNNTTKSRKLAVAACIETTLRLLTKLLSDQIKTLILWTGVGTSLQTGVLNYLWNVSKQEADETAKTLYGFSLVQFTNVAIYLTSDTQRCIEVHAVISQYIVDTIESKEVGILSPFVGSTHMSVRKGLMLEYEQSCGVRDIKSLAPKVFLEFKFNELQKFGLPYQLKTISMHTITNPHMIKLTLERIRSCLENFPYMLQRRLLSLFGEEIDSRIAECKEILKGAYKMCRNLNQNVQNYLFVNKNFDRLIESVQEFFEHYPLGDVAQKAVDMTKKIIPYCEGDGEALYYMTLWCEDMQTMTTEYHGIITLILPMIKLLVDVLKRITTSLQNKFAGVEQIRDYFVSDKLNEEMHLLWVNYLINLQKVSPNIVIQLASEGGTN